MIKAGIQTFGVLFMALGMAACSHPAAVKQNTAGEVAPPAPVVQAAPATNETVLGPGDDIAISVWRNTDLTSTARVDPAGNIQVPLAGEIHAAGLTVTALRGEIASRLTKYILNPQVQVSLTNLKSRKIHVLGEVKSPGTFVMDQAIMPWEAVAKASGFTPDANRQKVLLIREEGGTNSMTTLDMKAVLDGPPPPVLPPLRNGDIVYVLPMKIANFERFMTRFSNILAPFVNAVSLVVLTQGAVDIAKGNTR